MTQADKKAASFDEQLLTMKRPRLQIWHKITGHGKLQNGFRR